MAAISNNHIAEAIFEAIRGKSNEEASQIYPELVRLLARKGLLSKSKDILIRLNKIINTKEGKVEAKVISAEKLSQNTKSELAHSLSKRYSGREIILKEHIDDKVLGGFRIEINDEVIDLTVKNKINKLQEHLTRK